jgi:nucleotide-binding universal stress UspA family protein
MFQNSLICTDFSDGLDRLIHFVPSLARSGLKQIIFCHSVPLWEEGRIPRIDEEKILEAKKRLSEAFKAIPEGIEVKVEVLSGRPLETITALLETYKIDVIILGSSVRSLLQEKVFGSTSASLTKSTKTPLTIIRPQLITTYTQEELALRCQHLWHYLLIPYNGSATANYLIEQIEKYYQTKPEKFLKKCALVWAIDDATLQGIALDSKIQEAKEKLSSIEARLEALGLEVETEVRQGNPLQEVLNTACYYNITAIAIATDLRNKLLEWTVPSFPNELLRNSWFPLLLFPQKK